MQLAQGPGKTVVVQPKSGKPLAHLDAAYPFDGLVIAAPQETGIHLTKKNGNVKAPESQLGRRLEGRTLMRIIA